ncbi:hypothetical protein DPMN_067562, partial [Dreissena polymorpha]
GLDGITYTLVDGVGEAIEGQQVTMVTDGEQLQGLPGDQLHTLQQLGVLEIAPDMNADQVEGSTVKAQGLVCHLCSQVLSSFEDYKEHLQSAHNANIKDFSETDDNVGAATIAVLDSQGADNVDVADDVEGGFLKCPYCSRLFSVKWQNSLLEHLNTCHPQHSGPIAVELVRMEEWKEHDGAGDTQVSGVHDTQGKTETKGQAICPLCEMLFPRKSSLPKHLRAVHNLGDDDIEKLLGVDFDNDTKFACPLCPKTFNWPRSLKKHMIEAHDPAMGSASKKGCYFKCPYCSLVTRYACSVRKHISRKHALKCVGIDVNKMEIPRVSPETVDSSKLNIKVLDKRPAQEKFVSFSCIFRCPFCEYTTQLPSNMTRHLTSKAHNNIFSAAELKSIKVASFRVTKVQNSSNLPNLQLQDNLKSIINDKRKLLGLPFLNDLPDGNEEEAIVFESEITDEEPNHTSEPSTIFIDCLKTDGDPDTSFNNAVSSITSTGPEEPIVAADENEHNKINPVDSIAKPTTQVPEAIVKVKCLKCPIMFSDIQSLLQHVVLHGNILVNFLCSVCKQKFPFFSKLIDHDKKCHKGNFVKNVMKSVTMAAVSGSNVSMTTYDCPYCEMLFSQLKTLEHHIEQDHTDNLQLSMIGSQGQKIVSGFYCFFCELVFAKVDSLVKHMQIGHPGAKRPSQDDALLRKSARKRKLPKWLEADMEVDEEVVKKTRTDMPVRVDSFSSSADLFGISDHSLEVGKEQEVSEANMACSPGRKIKKTIFSKKNTKEDKPPQSQNTNEDQLSEYKNTTEGHQQQSENTNLDQLTHFKNISEDQLHLKDNVEDMLNDVTNMSNENPHKTAVEKKRKKRGKSKNTPQYENQIDAYVEKMKLEAAVESNSCPYCDFKARRAAALAFHINMNHPKTGEHMPENVTVKEEIEDQVIDDSHIFDGSDGDDDFESVLDEEEGDEHELEEDDDIVQVELVSDRYGLYMQHECPYCSQKNFKTSLARNQHVQQKHPSKFKLLVKLTRLQNSKQHQCPLCKNIFKNRKCVMTHLLSHDEFSTKDSKKRSNKMLDEFLSVPTVYKCSLCSVIGLNVESLHVHMEKQHPFEDLDSQEKVRNIYIIDTPKVEDIEVKYMCPFCPLKSSWRSVVYRHVGRKHPEAVGISVDTLAAEPEIREAEYACPYCLDKFVSREAVQLHSQVQHASQPSLHVEEIKLAVDIEENEGALKCPYCSMESQYATSIARHVSRCHPNKVQHFRLNQTCFNSENDVYGIQSGKLFSCSTCNFKSKYRNCVKRHVLRKHPHVPAHKSILMSSKQPIEQKMPSVVAKETGLVGSYNNLLYYCPLCSFECDKQKVVLNHLIEEHGKDKWHPDRFTSKDVLKKIIIGKGHNFIYICKQCIEGFHSLQALMQHFKQSHRKRKVQYKVRKMAHDDEFVNMFGCPHCSYRSVWPRLVDSHIDQVHPRTPLKAPSPLVCGVLSVQEASGVESALFRCPSCAVCCTSRQGVVLHGSLSHPDRPRSQTVHPVLEHLRVASKPGSVNIKQVLQCSQCERMFCNVPSIEQHLKTSHPEVSSGHNWTGLYKQMVSQSKNKNALSSQSVKCVCPACGRECANLRSLQAHMKVAHESIAETYTVLENILDTVSNAVEPRHHHNIRKRKPAFTGRKSGRYFHCGLCRLVVRSGPSLRLHYRLKHATSRSRMGQSRPRCCVCHRTVSSWHQLMQHKIKAHRNKQLTFRCRTCFRQFSSLKDKLAHGDVCPARTVMFECPFDNCGYRQVAVVYFCKTFSLNKNCA